MQRSSSGSLGQSVEPKGLQTHWACRSVACSVFAFLVASGGREVDYIACGMLTEKLAHHPPGLWAPGLLREVAALSYYSKRTASCISLGTVVMDTGETNPALAAVKSEPGAVGGAGATTTIFRVPVRRAAGSRVGTYKDPETSEVAGIWGLAPSEADSS